MLLTVILLVTLVLAMLAKMIAIPRNPEDSVLQPFVNPEPFQDLKETSNMTLAYNR